MRIEQDWLRAPALVRVAGALTRAGGEVRVVGGAVRDALASRGVNDIDLATTLRPEDVIRAAEAAGIKAVPTGLAHGTVTLVADHVPFEVTSLRRDVSTDGRHAEVVFTDSWQEDAARRDFTMNALSCDLSGAVSDFFGGVEDIAAGRVRFVGNPLQRIREDVLRILRFFRFHAQYGRGEPDPAGYTACGMLAPLLPSLSRERVRAEFLKLLAAPDPVPTLRLMLECGVIHALKLPLRNVAGLQAVVAAEVLLGQADALRRLFALLDQGSNLDRFCSELRLSGAEAARLRGMAQPLLLPADGAGLLRHAYWHGPVIVMDQLVLQGRANGSLLQLLQSWIRPQFPLSGADLLALGVPAGPRLGEQLKRIEQWWVEHDFAPDKAACLAQIRN